MVPTLILLFFYVYRLVLSLKSKTVVRSFAFPPHGNTLVGACDDGCFLWRIDDMLDKSNDKPR